MRMVAPIFATQTAVDAVIALRQRRGQLIFYQSGGCCGGSLPMCFEEKEFRIGDNDILLGYVVGCPFYIDPRQYAKWKHTQLILDINEGEPAGFSLGPADGWHFITRSRVFTPEELLARQ
ncbi:MAG TPA: DUF779 domain-containing protein [Mycobacterium sp.]|nr:DUF779 domain-containing protein [Mycobacterium sp.]HUH69651.1 DUF779 domain-containing protein [Mycobacterium sp.]